MIQKRIFDGVAFSDSLCSGAPNGVQYALRGSCFRDSVTNKKLFVWFMNAFPNNGKTAHFILRCRTKSFVKLYIHRSLVEGSSFLPPAINRV